ncbi:MAG TPA: TonB-dependent receptor [Caulobacteraceae bacterium]|jgi:iron complex outermembrane receptor protein
MRLRKPMLICSSSVLAVLAAGAVSPAFAADPAPQADTTVSEVVVTGVKASLQKAISIKRQSDNVVDAISSDDIGKLPDKNVADALSRLPGLNTVSASSGEGGFDEKDRVSIRGTNPSLTQVLINDHPVSTGDWFILDQFQTVGRSVSFTLLPSEIVNTAEASKSQSANMVEGGVAGSINILTRDPLALPTQTTVEAELQGEYGSLAADWKPQASALLGWKNSDDTLGIIVQGFYEARDIRRDGQEDLGWAQVGSGDATGAAIPSLVGKWYPTLIGSSLFQQQRVREGGDATIQWKPNDEWEFKLDGFYSHMNATNYNTNYMFWGSKEFTTNVPTSYTVKGDTITGASFPLVGPGGPTDGVVVDNIYRPNESSSTMYVNLDGAYHPSSRLNFKFQLGYTEGHGDTPSAPSFEVDGPTGAAYNYTSSGVAAVSFANITPSNPAGLFNDWAWNETFNEKDKETYGKIDGTYDLDDGPFKALKFGIRANDHTRQVVGWDHGCSIGANGQCWTGGGGLPFSAVDPTGQDYPSNFGSAFRVPGFLSNPAIGNTGLITSTIVPILAPRPAGSPDLFYYWPGTFKVNEVDTAGYIMAEIGGDRWHGNFGVRLVDSQLSSYVNSQAFSTTPGVITSSAFGDYIVTKVDHNYFDVLPSINLTFNVQDDLLLRFAANEAISRPDYSALAGAVSLTDLTLTGNGGNPNLKPIRSNNYDIGLEWYYAPTSLLAGHLFYMDLSSYVGYGLSTAQYYSMFYNAIKTYTITSPVNTSGKSEGLELQWQQPIAYGFGFQANYTYADGSDAAGHPLVGDSRNTFNATGYFENHWLSARLAYTYRSHFFVGLDRSSAENQDNTGELDASVNVKVTPNVTITADALNLTDPLLKYYAENKNQPRAVYDNGRQFYVGLRIKY